MTECSRLEGDEPGGLTCSVCSAVLVNQHEFTRHIRGHNRVIEDEGSGVKMYECGLCKKQLSSNSSLDRHMLVHSGERPFRCHICGTHFTTNGNMHRHIRGHYRNGGGSDTGDSDDGGSSFRKRKLEEDEGPVAKVCRFSESEEELSCSMCGAEEKTPSLLDDHVAKEHPLQVVTCAVCSVAFRSRSDLLEHQYSTHDRFLSPGNDATDAGVKGPAANGEVTDRKPEEEALHKCSYCSASFSSFRSWILHHTEHAVQVPFNCSKCGKSCDTLTEFTLHQQNHSQASEPQKENFLALFSLHNKDRQSPQLSAAVSQVTQPVLSFTSSLKVETRPPDHQTQMALNRHVTTLTHEEQFARHYRDMKLNGQYPCRLCKEVFANLRKLKSHNLIHMVSPPYSCNLCSYFSNDKNTLKEHMKTHKGDTPFECNLCNLSFTTKANCERHIKNIHGCQCREDVKKCMTYTPTEDSPQTVERSPDTVCHICFIDCKSRSVLRDHIRSSHPEGVDKPFSCKLCKLAFSSRNDAFRHTIQHHSEQSRGNMETLIEQRISREEVQDLSSVESLITISKLSLPMSTSVRMPCPETQETVAHHPKISLPSEVHSYMNVPSIMPTLPLSFPSVDTPPDDVPLDLSMKKKESCDEDSAGAIAKDTDSDTGGTKKEEEETKEDTKELLNATPPLNLSSQDLKNPVNLTPSPYKIFCQSQLPVHLYPFQQQYPFLVSPFATLPQMGNFDPALLEHCHKEFNRGLQLSSGGGILTSSDGGFLQSAPSSLHLSALALAASQNEQISNTTATDRPERLSGTESLKTSATAKEAEDDVLHFAMRNSVLVKKPKQRRYRTERPWRCDLCDKGFTLRSNMERHMKQQHPDLWHHKPKTSGAPKSEINVRADLKLSMTEEVREQLKNKLGKECEQVSESEENREEEDSELIIDDLEEDEEKEEEEHILSQVKEENGVDLVSVHKLLSTACQNYSFFHADSEEMNGEDSSSSCHDLSSEEGKKSAYSSAPQKQKCPFCSRKFPWSSSLVRHIRTHTGQKPYMCPVCNFPFTTKSNCDRHLQRKHPDSPHTLGGDRPFRCSKCPGAAFTSVESLRKHDMFKHEKACDTTSKDEARPFRCYLCEACLPSRKAGLDHLEENHEEHFHFLDLAESRKALVTTSDNNNVSLTLPDSTTSSTMLESCMICLQKYWSLAELKQHVMEEHLRPQRCSSAPPQQTPSILSTLTHSSASLDDVKSCKSAADLFPSADLLS